ncbi:MAG: DUF6457 domain-containing protein [Acidimicrobiales bacterium]
MTRDEWLVTFADALGVPAPTPDELDALLDVAGLAARASERQAAPVSCWLIGRAGVTPADALAAARRLGGPDVA